MRSLGFDEIPYVGNFSQDTFRSQSRSKIRLGNKRWQIPGVRYIEGNVSSCLKVVHPV